jgi:hypothetical protein
LRGRGVKVNNGQNVSFWLEPCSGGGRTTAEDMAQGPNSA